jgi:2-enoate reductase
LIKKNVSIPIIVVGRLDNPHVADTILAEEKADFIALGRALLADPEWPNKAKAKRFDDIRPCIGDHDGCLGRIFKGRYLSCVVNPQTGKEREFNLKPASEKKSILVVGGGPGGMEAARVAPLRGHKITLWEKNGQLGGNLLPASVPSFNSDLRNLISYLSNQIEMLGVKIHLKKEATPDLIINHNPDEVIIATGAVPVVPEIPGIEKAQVVTASALLTGESESGKDVIVFGGGYMGCHTAIWLAERNKKITIIEALNDLMVGMFPANRQYLLSLIDDFGITVMTETKLLEITDNGVMIEKSGQKKALETETVTFAVGLKPLTNLNESLKNNHFRVHAIGDCVLPRKVQGAIWDAFRLTRLI